MILKVDFTKTSFLSNFYQNQNFTRMLPNFSIENIMTKTDFYY
jgi:hypothetical protein